MVEPKADHWLRQPSQCETILFGGLGIFAIVSIMLVMTNYGLESPFKSRNMVFGLLWINAVFVTSKIFINRWKAIQQSS